MIDAHQHFWKIKRGDYFWLNEDMKTLYRDFVPENLLPVLQRNKFTGTVLVQAAPAYEETLFLLSLYDKYDWIYGVVGWLDLASPSFQKQLNVLIERKGLVGIRPMLQDIEEENWILQNQVIKNLKCLIEYDLRLDLLINKKHFSSIITLMETLPDLRAVVNHMAKPNIAEGEWDDWRKGMKELSRFPNVWCKLSGLITEADKENWKMEDFSPYINKVLEDFGTSRVFFGSDWPVCLTAGSYEEVIEIVRGNLPDRLTDEEINNLFYLNAKTFYKLDERRVSIGNCE